MIELRAAGTRIRLHPLLLLLPMLAHLLGGGAEIGALALGLMAHEAAHLAAARLCRVRVEALRLMPFGGAMELGNLYALPPGRLFAVAAAGPAANLAMVCLGAALAHWRAISPASRAAWRRPLPTRMSAAAVQNC